MALIHQDELIAWEERAAIMEHEGGLSRADAEREATALVLGDLGERMRAHRESLGWTQERAAAALRVSLRTYHSWERGGRPPRMGAYLIVRWLECSSGCWCRSRVSDG